GSPLAPGRTDPALRRQAGGSGFLTEVETAGLGILQETEAAASELDATELHHAPVPRGRQPQPGVLLHQDDCGPRVAEALHLVEDSPGDARLEAQRGLVEEQ